MIRHTLRSKSIERIMSMAASSPTLISFVVPAGVYIKIDLSYSISQVPVADLSFTMGQNSRIDEFPSGICSSLRVESFDSRNVFNGNTIGRRVEVDNLDLSMFFCGQIRGIVVTKSLICPHPDNPDTCCLIDIVVASGSQILNFDPTFAKKMSWNIRQPGVYTTSPPTEDRKALSCAFSRTTTLPWMKTDSALDSNGSRGQHNQCSQLCCCCCCFESENVQSVSLCHVCNNCFFCHICLLLFLSKTTKLECPICRQIVLPQNMATAEIVS